MVLGGFRLDISHPPCGSLSLPWMIRTSPIAASKLPVSSSPMIFADGATGGASAGH